MLSQVLYIIDLISETFDNKRTACNSKRVMFNSRNSRFFL
jgi:hypothetical protein